MEFVDVRQSCVNVDQRGELITKRKQQVEITSDFR